MKLSEHLRAVNRLFLDTSPVIYFVEENPHYLALVQPVFDRIDAGALVAVTSPITLSECLVHPYRLHKTDAATALTAGCNAFLTNDPALKRVTALDVIVLDEVEGE
jgi:predicted nucleic acid-binding protein